MTNRFMITLALVASAAAGVGAGVLVSQVAVPENDNQDVKSITGVSSGVAGSNAKDPEKEGIDQITVPPEPNTTSDPASATDATTNQPPSPATDPDRTQSQTVDIEGVEGTEGVDTERENTPPKRAVSANATSENTVEILTTSDETMQAIRGIKGIDSVMLQNLETVLRMQAPPPPPEEGGGGSRAAAALLTMETDEPPDPEEEVDGREELTEFELEGS